MQPTISNSLGEKGELTKQLILETAAQKFAQFGLQGTRVRDIADAASVNVATLYNYYKNKQALYEAVLDDGIYPMVEIMAQFSTYELDEYASQQLVEAILLHLQQHPNICKLIYLESINEGEYLRILSERWFKPLMQEAIKYFGDEFTQAQKQQLISLFFHLSFGHFSLSPLIDQVFNTQTASKAGVTAHAQFTLNLLKQIFPRLN